MLVMLKYSIVPRKNRKKVYKSVLLCLLVFIFCTSALIYRKQAYHLMRY